MLKFELIRHDWNNNLKDSSKTYVLMHLDDLMRMKDMIYNTKISICYCGGNGRMMRQASDNKGGRTLSFKKYGNLRKTVCRHQVTEFMTHFCHDNKFINSNCGITTTNLRFPKIFCYADNLSCHVSDKSKNLGLIVIMNLLHKALLTVEFWKSIIIWNLCVKNM